MKERIKIIDFKYKVAFFSFFFFLIISAISPISGTDWGSYFSGKDGIKSCIDNIYINDGRIISGFLANFLSYNKLIFDVVFSFLMSSFVLCCNNLMGYVKNKYYYLFPFLGTLLVSVFLFSYNYTSVTTTVIYTFPAIISFLYFEYIWKKETSTFNLKEIIILGLISTYISLSSIHISLVFLLGNVIYYTYSTYKKKNFTKQYFLIIALQIIALIISLTNIEKPLLYDNLKVTLNQLPNYIDKIFSKNIVLIILGAIPINYYLNDKLRNWVYNRVVITLFDLILLFSLTYNFFNYSPVNLNLIINKYSGVFATENWYYIFFFITYIVLFFLSIRQYIKELKTKKYIILLSIMSFAMSIFSILSPIWDEGNVIFIVLFVILAVSILLKELEFAIYPKVLIGTMLILISYYFVSFLMIRYIDYTRGEYIQEQLDANTEIIEVKANPIYLVWRYNPVNVFQQKDFKKYYNIPQNKHIKVRYFGIFEKIEKKVKE